MDKKKVGLGNKYAKERALREFEKQGKVSKSVHVIKVGFFYRTKFCISWSAIF